MIAAFLGDGYFFTPGKQFAASPEGPWPCLAGEEILQGIHQKRPDGYAVGLGKALNLLPQHCWQHNAGRLAIVSGHKGKACTLGGLCFDNLLAERLGRAHGQHPEKGLP
jgi:hypothetical protein